MYVMYPIAYPTALILDAVLGKEEGTTYKKAGLKTLVSLHRTLGTERLNDDEVTIITAVLDLKEKPVGDIMTPLKDVYVMSADQIMDVKTMNEIMSKGYSRIPIHAPGRKKISSACYSSRLLSPMILKTRRQSVRLLWLRCPRRRRVLPHWTS